MNGWQAGRRDPLDPIAISHLAAFWHGVFEVFEGESDYRARRLTGGPVLTADTPVGLESAIRAAWAREVDAGGTFAVADPLLRLDQLREQHPDIVIGSRLDTWRAVVPQDGGERCLARRTLAELLDAVDEILAGGDPRAPSG